MGTEDQRNNENGGPVGTEAQRNSGPRGPVEQWVQRTRGTEDLWVQRTRGPVVITDNFENEVERFSHRGYFTGELGNLMVLAMANVLKMPIVIFSSLENFPIIPIQLRQQLHGMPSLFISFDTAGCGHYYYVCRENYLSGPEEKMGEEIKKKEKRAKVFCSRGVSRKG